MKRSIYSTLSCVCICFLSVVTWMNPFWQIRHTCGLSPVCLIIWSLRVPDFPNDFSQCGQGYGFSLRWTILICRCLFVCRLNIISHSSHGYLVSGWRILCWRNEYSLVNISEQMSHLNWLPLVWVNVCAMSAALSANVFPHCLQIFLLSSLYWFFFIKWLICMCLRSDSYWKGNY